MCIVPVSPKLALEDFWVCSLGWVQSWISNIPVAAFCMLISALTLFSLLLQLGPAEIVNQVICSLFMALFLNYPSPHVCIIQAFYAVAASRLWLHCCLVCFCLFTSPSIVTSPLDLALFKVFRASPLVIYLCRFGIFLHFPQSSLSPLPPLSNGRGRGYLGISMSQCTCGDQKITSAISSHYSTLFEARLSLAVAYTKLASP